MLSSRQLDATARSRSFFLLGALSQKEVKMSAKSFRVGKWITFGISVITSALFFVNIEKLITTVSPEMVMLAIVFGGVIAWLFNTIELGLMEQYLFPWVGGRLTGRAALPTIILLPILFVDIFSTYIGVSLLKLPETFTIIFSILLPFLYELLSELEKRADGKGKES